MNQHEDTEGNSAHGRFVGDAGQEDTEGQGHRGPGGPEDAGQDDTEGSGRKPPGLETSDDEDDVAGHLRMTDDQLAAGLTPSEIAAKGSPRDPAGPPRD